MTNQLKSVLDRALTLPAEDQEELVVELAREIELRQGDDVEVTDEDLRAIRVCPGTL